jgi:CRP-like cAMP-binding protein
MVQLARADPVTTTARSSVEIAIGTSEATAGLTPAQVAVLAAGSRELSYESGDVVIELGAISPGLQVVAEGAVRVESPAQSGVMVSVATLGPGAVFGELSALAGTPAISRVVAAQDATRVRTIDLESLDATDEGMAIRERMMRNIIRMNQARLSLANLSYVKQLEETLALMAQRHAYARFLVLVIVLFGICLLVNKWVTDRGNVDLYSPAFAWAYLGTMVLPTIFVVWRAKYPLRVFGLTTKGIGTDLRRASVITAILVALILGGLWAAGYPIGGRFQPGYLLRYGPLYALHSALQEFMVRGVLLGVLLTIFGDDTFRERQGANFVASLMFSLVHIHFGVAAVLVTFGFSLLLGTYYLVSRNLAGVALIHVVVGLVAFMVGLI